MTYTPSVVIDSKDSLAVSGIIYPIISIVVHNPNCVVINSKDAIETSGVPYVIIPDVVHSVGLVIDSKDSLVVSGFPYLILPIVIHNPSIDLKAHTRLLEGDTSINLVEGYVFNFFASPNYGPRPLAVQFVPDLKWFMSVVEWDFGDGSTSVLEAPEHIYQEAGYYEVMLTVQIGTEQIVGKKKRLVHVVAVELLPNIRKVGVRNTIFQNYYTVQQKL